MSKTEYYKQKLVNQNISVEYSSEDDEITIRFEHKLNNGAHIGSDYMRIHPSYVKPLCDLLNNLDVTTALIDTKVEEL